ncbi:MAG: FMN-binding protein, partial [Deltaproteobacteria bacterium]|nr:FMN-binding protein [Deltaproteobacteria bacterium]
DAAPDEAAAEAAPKAEMRLTEPPKGNIIATAWLVLLLGAMFGSGLAGIEIWLRPKIDQNKLNETLSEIPNLVKGASKGAPDDKTIPGRRVFRALSAGGDLLGWVVLGKGQGFGGTIEVLIGLDREAKKLTGIFILAQNETPGLGNYISDKPFTSEFPSLKVGAGGHKLIASQAPPQHAKGQIKAVTGATISSVAVCNIINKTVGEVQSKLATAAKGG